MRIKMALAGLFLTASLAFGQSGPNHFLSSSGDVSLSSAAYAVTLQQSSLLAASGGRDVVIESATVYCSVAATVTHSKNGTAATATAGTPVSQPGNGTAATSATFWTASNTTPGTTLRIDHIPAGGTFTWNFNADFRLMPLGTGSNYTISIASLTGTCNISIQHSEPR